MLLAATLQLSSLNKAVVSATYRCCAAARAALYRASPRNPGFYELALQHGYPLRHLNANLLPIRNLVSYLAKVRGGNLAHLYGDGQTH